MLGPGAYIRDPLYGDIYVFEIARAIVDAPEFQRLRRIRQLGQATVVYPGAMHTRFEHAVGVYHLAGEILRVLRDRGELAQISDEECLLVRLAALLHDLGHYPAAHFLEEYGLEGADHEEAGAHWFSQGVIGEALRATGIPDAADRVAALVAHHSTSPLQNIVSSSCDADKIDYIGRDPYHCGLAVGFDRHTLIGSQTLVTDPATGRPTVGLAERGLPAFEQMLFAKYALYRMIFFHETTRSATVMMRKLIVAALQHELLDLQELRECTDEEVFSIVRSRVLHRRRQSAATSVVGRLTERLTNRSLYAPAASVPIRLATRLSPNRLSAVEEAMAAELGLGPGEALLDVPHRPNMLSTDVLMRRTSGEVVSIRDLTPDDGFALSTAGTSFYHASGRMTLFTSRPVDLPAEAVLDLLHGQVAESAPAAADRSGRRTHGHHGAASDR